MVIGNIRRVGAGPADALKLKFPSQGPVNQKGTDRNLSRIPAALTLVNLSRLSGTNLWQTAFWSRGCRTCVPRGNYVSIARCFTSDVRELRFSGSAILSWGLWRS
jgi:hypothetical protein